MNDINYEELTTAELGKMCEERRIDVDSKNVSKPTKAEFIAALEKDDTRKDEGVDDFLDLSEDKPEDNIDGMQEEDKTKKVDAPKPLTRAQKRRKQYNEAHMLKRVVINSNSDNQTKTNFVWISWGNRLLGHQTDRVILGKPWHVRNGALENMKDAVITESVQNHEQNRVDTITKPAYIIQELAPLTKQEIADIAKRQQVRDSSIDSLI